MNKSIEVFMIANEVLDLIDLAEKKKLDMTRGDLQGIVEAIILKATYIK